ncbi:MAG: hypothetical protein QOJ64_2976 [Acidobacteriota bacterium]|jgi:hypothetical protein|nr:hypothetical protein [Acidobacteriota bacterium]
MIYLTQGRCLPETGRNDSDTCRNTNPVGKGGLLLNEFVTWGLPIFAGLALIALSYNQLQTISRSADYLIAQFWFALGVLVILARFIYWAIFSTRGLTVRITVSAAVGLALVGLTFDAFRSINHKRERWVQASQASQAKSDPLPLPPASPEQLPLGLPAAVEPKATKPETEIRPSPAGPNLVFKKPRIVRVLAKRQTGQLHEIESGSPFAVVDIKNDANVGFDVIAADVRAVINFEEIGGSREIPIPDGTWLAESKNYAHFRLGETKTLVIAGFIEKVLAVELKYRLARGLHHISERIYHELPGREYKADVQLFANYPRKMVGQREYRVRTQPELQIEELRNLTEDEILERLAELQHEGANILRKLENHHVLVPYQAEAERWAEKVEIFLMGNGKKTYALRFNNSLSTHQYPSPATGTTRGLFDWLYTRLMRLDEFVRELGTVKPPPLS